MSDQNQQLLMMMGFGALALFQGFQVYRMSKQLEKQQEVIMESARSQKAVRSEVASEISDEERKDKVRTQQAPQ